MSVQISNNLIDNCAAKVSVLLAKEDNDEPRIIIEYRSTDQFNQGCDDDEEQPTDNTSSDPN